MLTPDKKMFLDMQEHPEKYPTEQLEAMMDELDQTPDVSAAWQQFEGSKSSLLPIPPPQGEGVSPLRGDGRGAVFNGQLKKLAAIFVGVILLSGIAYAAIHLMRRQAATNPQSPIVNRQSSMVNIQPSDPVRFDNVRLDSILAVVSAHYDKAVRFDSDETKDMTFILTWEPDAPLDDFIDGMNMFDGLQLTLQRDTIFVEAQEVTEDAE